MAITSTIPKPYQPQYVNNSGIMNPAPAGAAGGSGSPGFVSSGRGGFPPPVSSLPVGDKTGSDSSGGSGGSGGLMAAAMATTRQPPQTNTAVTYNPTGYTAETAGAASYNPSIASAQGYNAITDSASSYAPTMVDRAGTQYDPTLQAVDSNQLVSNQLDGLISGNSKYIQDARQQGLEQAARSGLMTSSIAAGNAERSAIQAALPIAQQDASRYGSVADQNMAAGNTADQFNAGQTMQMSLADANAVNTSGQFNANATNQMAMANMEAKNRAAEFGASADNSASQFNANAFNQAGQFNANAFNNVSQFNANSSNQAAAYNANASNEAGQFNVGQINGMNQSQQQLAEQQYQYDRTLNAQQSNAFFGQQYQREQQLSSVLQSIYENPNLTAEQQQQAASNAKVVLQGVWNATNQTFSSGVPDIFTHV